MMAGNDQIAAIESDETIDRNESPRDRHLFRFIAGKWSMSVLFLKAASQFGQLLSVEVYF
jgi:hypothetical protein